MRCDTCGRNISEKSDFCPYCVADKSFVEYNSVFEDYKEVDDDLDLSFVSNDYIELSKVHSHHKWLIKSPFDKLTLLLSLIIMVILFGVMALLFRQSVTDLFVLETVPDVFTDESISEPNVIISPEKIDIPKFSRAMVQLYPGEYVELTLHLQSSLPEEWAWMSSDPDKISVNSAGIVTSGIPGAAAEVSVYNIDDPDLKSTIMVICLSEDVQHEIDVLERLNGERYPFGRIDFNTVQFETGSRNQADLWDASIIQELGHSVSGSDPDNHISSYVLHRYRRFSTQNNAILDLDVYRHPQTHTIRKISTIERTESNNMVFTDYYFSEDGRLNFVSVQNQMCMSTVDCFSEHFEQFFFDQDILVRWRSADAQGDVFSIVLNEGERNAHFVSEESLLYEELETIEIESFDLREKDIINTAYVLYHEMNQGGNVYQISGVVMTEEGMPIEGAEVTLLDQSHHNVDLYQTHTNANGMYVIYISNTNNDYGLRIEKNEYTSVHMMKISLFDNVVDQFQERVILPNQRSAQYQMNFLVADAVEWAEEIVWQDRFDTDTLRISFAEIIIREGIGNKTGDYIASVFTDGHGIANVRLPVGAYTVEVYADGYVPLYASVFIYPNRHTERLFMSPVLEESAMRIMLTWQNMPADLDLHMFTPYNRAQNPQQDYIGFHNDTDIAGNRYHIDSRNGFGPESVTIHAFEQGAYHVFVTDYDQCLSNHTGTLEMLYSQARVYVYTAEGEVFTFHVPVKQNGNLWAVFEIRNQQIIPTQRLYINAQSPFWCSVPKDDE